MPTIDIHNHFIPMVAIDGARKGSGFDGLTTDTVDGEEWLVHRQGYRYPLQRGFYDLAERLRSMDERHVDQAVMSISPTMFMYWAGASAAADFCRQTNDEMAAFGKASGGRLHPVATLPMQDPDLAAAELRRAVSELGLYGAQIGPVIEGTWLDQADVRTVLATAQELGVPLSMHPYFVGAKPGLEDFYMTNLVGNPLETVICATRLIFSGLMDELPSLSLVLMHGGGYFPYQIGRLDHGHEVRPEAKGSQHAPSSYLRRFYYDTVTHAPRPLRFLVDLAGADNVLYGTDYPYDMAAGPLSDQLDGTGLDAESTERIAGRNAARLFRLPVGR
ncbi:MAG: amidohydrolase family protein [Solirubrobacteraceae bacterium]